jgi:hypothetical protein
MMLKGVLLDTSFFLRFLNESDPFFKNADNYFQHLLDKEVPRFLSTIVVAEYCVGGSVDQLPLRYVKMLPFNVEHAIKAGAFRAVFRGTRMEPGERQVITNDLKLFAQADATPEISHFLTADEQCRKMYDRISESGMKLSFDILSIRTPLNEVLGQLDFPA